MYDVWIMSLLPSFYNIEPIQEKDTDAVLARRDESLFNADRNEILEIHQALQNDLDQIFKVSNKYLSRENKLYLKVVLTIMRHKDNNFFKLSVGFCVIPFQANNLLTKLHNHMMI